MLFFLSTETVLRTAVENSQSQELKKELESQMASKKALEESATEQERKLDTLLSRRTQYLQRQDDVSKKIRELGSLPSDAFEKYRGKGTKELHRLLKHVGDELKQFSHVNKKALEQYVTFTEQREDLLKRQTELQAGAHADPPPPPPLPPRASPAAPQPSRDYTLLPLTTPNARRPLSSKPPPPPCVSV